MSCKKVMLQGAIPKRYVVEHIYNGIEYNAIYTGDMNDATNFDVSETPTWDSDKTDYKIEDRVKIEELGKEYICGVDGTRRYPPSSSDWKEVGSMKEYAYRDGTPLSQSTKTYVDGENVEIELFLRTKDNYLFLQNLENVNEIFIEKWINDMWVEMYRENLSECVSFSPCTCCLLEWQNKTNFTYKFEDCLNTTKIRVSLVQIVDTIARVGMCAVGEFVSLGYLAEYPQPKVESDTKFNILENGLSIPAKNNIYLNYSLKVYIDAEVQDRLYKKLIAETGKLNFYEISDYADNILTNFIGFHKGFTPTIKASGDMELNFNIYGIPSKGV